MRNSKASSGVRWRDAFKIIKICFMGLSMASVPLFMKPLFVGTYEFLSVTIPQVRETLSAWLTPAFLYIILNCIIIAIVVNSGLGIFNISTHHSEDFSSSSNQQKENKPKPNLNPIVGEYIEESNQPKTTLKPIVGEYNEESNQPKTNLKPIVGEHYEESNLPKTNLKPNVGEYNEELCTVEKISETTSISLATANSEAETLEDAWKAIIRRTPPARQLKKADTWETHRPRPRPPALESASFSRFEKKSGRTLDRQIVGAEMLKKEPSLGQDELNQRVEAFIAKVNHDMKLQREESLLHYKEMVNRGSG